MPEAVVYSLEEQIACVKRELGYRERVYSRWVISGKMRQEKAVFELGCMRSVLARLEALKAPPAQRELLG